MATDKQRGNDMQASGGDRDPIVRDGTDPGLARPGGGGGVSGDFDVGQRDPAESAKTLRPKAPDPDGADPVVSAVPDKPAGIGAGRDMPGDLRPTEGEGAYGTAGDLGPDRPVDASPPTEAGAVKSATDAGSGARPPAKTVPPGRGDRD
jgi:hypothetical protein